MHIPYGKELWDALKAKFNVCQIQAHGTVHVAYFSQDMGWDMAHTLHLL
jgi:hypothetical protein